MAEVLVVDDDQDIVEALVDVLECEGYAVRTARDGVEGLECLKSRPFDLILLDVEMPRLNGPDMAYRMFVRDAGDEEIPIVLLSANLNLARVAASVGTPYFLAKPYSVDSLLALMARALSEHIP